VEGDVGLDIGRPRSDFGWKTPIRRNPRVEKVTPSPSVCLHGYVRFRLERESVWMGGFQWVWISLSLEFACPEKKLPTRITTIKKSKKHHSNFQYMRT